MCECKVCGKLKVRKDGGKRSGCSGRYKVDGEGRRWNGLSCPDCRSDYTGARSTKDAADCGPAFPLNKPKLRNCHDCGVKSHNYYRCPPCHTLYVSNNDHLYYGGYDEDMFRLEAGNTIGAGFRY